MRIIAAVLAVVLLNGGCSRHGSGERSIVCPEPQFPGISINAGELQGWSRELGQGSRYQIMQVATAIRIAHPTASDTEVTDLLVASYCRKFKGSGDTTGDRASVREFASRARAAIAGNGSSGTR